MMVKGDTKTMEKLQNWWDYHKWYVIAGGVLIWIIFDLAVSNWRARRDQPDFQIAYVARMPLDEGLTAFLEREFSLFAVDRNGDGKTNVRLIAYIYGTDSVVPDGGMAQMAADIRLVGDIAAEESFLFLTDDAERFQSGYRILADANGVCPSEEVLDVADRVVRLSDIGFSFELEAAAAAVDLDQLTIGRRCFPNDASATKREAENAFWMRLTGLD